MLTIEAAKNAGGPDIFESHRFNVDLIERRGSGADVAEAAKLLGVFPAGHAVRADVPSEGRLAEAMRSVAPVPREEAAKRMMKRFSDGGSNHNVNLLVDSMRAIVQGQSSRRARLELLSQFVRCPRRR